MLAFLFSSRAARGVAVAQEGGEVQACVEESDCREFVVAEVRVEARSYVAPATTFCEPKVRGIVRGGRDEV